MRMPAARNSGGRSYCRTNVKCADSFFRLRLLALWRRSWNAGFDFVANARREVGTTQGANPTPRGFAVGGLQNRDVPSDHGHGARG